MSDNRRSAGNGEAGPGSGAAAEGGTAFRNAPNAGRQAVYRMAASAFGLLLLLPVWLMLDGWFAMSGEPRAAIAAIPALSLLGAAAGVRLTRRWQQILPAVAAGALVGAAAAGPLGLAPLAAAALGAAAAFAWMQGVTVGERMHDTVWHWFGLGLIFCASVVYPYVDWLEPTTSILTTGGVACLIVSLFVTNGLFLRGASLSERQDRKVPASLRRHNRLLMSVLLVAAVLLTVLFGNAFGRLVLAGLRWLFGLLGKDNAEITEEVAPREPPPPPQPMPSEGEPSLITQILQIAFYVVGTAICAAILIGAGYWLYRNAGGVLREWVQRVTAFLRKTPEVKDEGGYTDEESGVFSWEAVGRRMKETWLGRLLSRGREERWEDQRTNRDRVRWLFRHWMSKAVDGGYEPKRSFTPRETAADVLKWSSSGTANGRAVRGADAAQPNAAQGKASVLVELYDRVRYGDADAGDDEIERAKRAADALAERAARSR